MIKFPVYLFGLVLLVSCSKPPIGDKVVVDVNGQTLKASQFAEELAFRLREMDALSAKDSNRLKRLKDKIVEEFIVQALTAQWAKDNSLLVKAEDIEREIDKARKGYPDDLTFQQALVDQGLTYKSWRARVEQSLLQKIVMKKLDEGLTKPTDAEILSYYAGHKDDFMEKEEVQIRQIVLNSESDARAIEEELKKGKSMTSLISKYSAHPNESQNPARLWVRRGEAPIFDAAFKMKVGRRSPIMKSEFGYHIFELLAHRIPKPKALAEVKSQIQLILMEKVEQTAYLSWLDAQIRKSRIFKDQELINSMKVETKVD